MEWMQFLTSWDDGYLLDLRIADLLDRYGVKGTFYVCPAAQHTTEMLSKDQIKELSSRYTIGAHSMTHPKLTQIPPQESVKEIRASKQWVEETTDKSCTTFCYPYGATNNAV